MKKSSNISATALHRFIPQPASGRSSALPCLAANIVLSKLLWEIHLHGLKFIPNKPTPILLRVGIFLFSAFVDSFFQNKSSTLLLLIVSTLRIEQVRTRPLLSLVAFNNESYRLTSNISCSLCQRIICCIIRT